MPSNSFDPADAFARTAAAALPGHASLHTFDWTLSPATRRRVDSLERFVQRKAQIFLLLFLASTLLNVLVGIFLKYRASPFAMDKDEQEYFDLSGQILAGHWDLGSRRTVLYPLILAGLRLINSNFLFLQVAVSAIAALSAPLLCLVVRRLSGSAQLGLIAAILMMLWPAQLFLATSLYSESVALPCFLLFLLALPLGSRALRPDWQGATNGQTASLRKGAILAGLALGITAHIRPMYLLFLPFALIIPFLEETSLRRAGRTSLLVGLSFAMVVLPWSLWMSSRHGEVIILTANGGETLAGGLNPRLAAMHITEMHMANREVWVGPGKWLPPPQTGFLSLAETQLPYEKMSHLLTQRSSAWIAAHPGDALRLELCKLGYMWGFYPWRGERLVKLLTGNLPILALLGIGLFSLSRRPVQWLGVARLLVLPLFTSAVCLISWGSWRFRQPADAALLAFCVIAMSITLRRQRAVLE